MSSIIFLDFDGVLNCVGTKDRIPHPEISSVRIRGIDKFRVELVSDLAAETQSSIVISSSWREFFLIDEISPASPESSPWRAPLKLEQTDCEVQGVVLPEILIPMDVIPDIPVFPNAEGSFNYSPYAISPGLLTFVEG